MATVSPTVKPRTVLDAVARRTFLISSWPWRALLYGLSTGPMTLLFGLPFGFCLLPLALLVSRVIHGQTANLGLLAVASVFGMLLFLSAGPAWAAVVAGVERQRLRMVDLNPVTVPFGPTHEPGWWPRMRARYTEPASWRELGYAVLLCTAIPALYAVAGMVALFAVVLVASPLLVNANDTISVGFTEVSTPGGAVPYALAGVLLLVLSGYLVAGFAGLHALLARALLTDGAAEKLRGELTEVAQSRTRLVSAFDAERKRIERDLHDGAQQRLVGLSLQLGLAKVDLPPDSEAAKAVSDAHDQAKKLMVELRELINGIHPRALAELGLPAALEELADGCAVPVTVDSAVPTRLPEPVESTAYFVVAESLTNVAKHSAASCASVSARLAGRLLTVEVWDNGAGGADPARGTGITGLSDRVAVLGGRMWVRSPVGGPTVVRVELPC
ncbi:sensor histidine kinase [Amycolatopsis silviterrae]|uniref:histidine kinase n=1 Tax=Amycolatopsis silviterrae TaxID=1656914 RepID=A0ABW5H0M5_9PSEU